MSRLYSYSFLMSLAHSEPPHSFVSLAPSKEEVNDEFISTSCINYSWLKFRPVIVCLMEMEAQLDTAPLNMGKLWARWAQMTGFRHLRHPIMASRVMLLLIDSTSAQNYSPDGRFNTLLIVFSQVRAVEIIGEPRAQLNTPFMTPIRRERSCSV